MKKEELLNVDDFDLINLRDESTPSEEHRFEDDRGNLNGLIEQRFKREALVLVRPKTRRCVQVHHFGSNGVAVQR